MDALRGGNRVGRRVQLPAQFVELRCCSVCGISCGGELGGQLGALDGDLLDGAAVALHHL